MNIVQIIAALRKFGNYLAGLFPIFVVIGDKFSKLFIALVEHPRVAPWWKRFCSSKFVQQTWKVIERFFWRTYSKNRLDLDEAPTETVALLRPLFQLTAILCILIPLTQFNFFPTAIKAFSGFEGIAPAWSVLLWLVCLPCAWAALLTGAARCNRIVLTVACVAASYFLITCVVLLPRSFFNAMMPLAILIAIIACEFRQRADSSRRNTINGGLTSIVCGIAAGIPLIMLTPIRPWLGNIITLPGPVISIGGGALLGAALGVGCFAFSRRAIVSDAAFAADKVMPVTAWAIIGALSIYLFTGLFRGDLSRSGSLLISSLELTTTYFWPLWYFMGVGILHKLSKSSKTLAYSVGDVMPAKAVKPVLMLVLLVSLFIAFSERICVMLSTSSNTILVAALPVLYQVYLFAKPFIWSNPLNTMAVHWFSWVLLFDLVLVSVLSIRRRLTNEALIRLLFLNVFAFLLIWEYIFQLSSFTRTPTHSTFVLFLFAVGLLWLMQTVGLDLCSKSSALWPSAGRLALYGGLSTFAILEIHARTASHDYKLMNELFLSMFHGVIDIGLPYYFLVWTTNRLGKLPVRIPVLLGLFCLGALTSLSFNVLEKFAAANWLVDGLTQIVQRQCESLRATGSINIDVAVPQELFLVRSLIYIALLAVIFLVARHKLKDTDVTCKAVLFFFLALASGIASFSKTLVELPLPPEVRALTAPCAQELVFNCSVFQSYSIYWIPALLLGLSQLYGKELSVRLFCLCAPLAVAVHYFGALLYAKYEVLLRANGALYTWMCIVGALFVLLVTLALNRLMVLDSDSGDDSGSGSDQKATLLTPCTLYSITAISAIILIPLAISENNLKFNNYEIRSLLHRAVLPVSWKASSTSDGASDHKISTLMRANAIGKNELLQIGTVESGGVDTKTLLQNLLLSAARTGNYPNLSPVSVETWNRFCPGALACHFTYELPNSKPVLTVAGLTVLIPRTDQTTEFYTLHTFPSEIEREQWEMAYSIKQMSATVK